MVLLDIQPSVEQTAAEIGASGFRVVDVSDVEELQRTIREVGDEFGGIDTLVNCAGTCGRESFEEFTPAGWDRDLGTNLKATAFACQAAVFPHMKKAGYGRIVNIASVSGKNGGVGPVSPDGSGGRSGAAYAAAKAGIINYTKWISREVGTSGITANAVCPGPIVSAMTAGAVYSVDEIPAGRQGETAEVAAAVSFLASRQASYISGQALNVDGGMLRI